MQPIPSTDSIWDDPAEPRTMAPLARAHPELAPRPTVSEEVEELTLEQRLSEDPSKIETPRGAARIFLWVCVALVIAAIWIFGPGLAE